MLPRGWVSTTIGDQVQLQRGLDITRSAQRAGRVPVVSSGGVSSHHDECAVRGPGVVLGRKGVVGSVYFIQEDYWPHDTTLWVKDFKGNDPRFVYYFFKGLAPQLTALDVGSANPTLNRNHVHPLETAWPPLADQRLIAATLGSLDDKIEHNQRTAKALEKLARTTFRAWFVDFEPVKAKASGEGSFPGINQATFETLPSELSRSESGPLPVGWKMVSLATIATFLNGLALQKYPPRADGKDLRVIKIAELRQGSTASADWANGDVPADYVVDDGDLLFSWSGTLEAKIWFGGKGALNQHLFKVTSESFPKWFYHLWIWHHLPWFRSIAASKATTMGHIQRRHLQEAKIVVPAREILDAVDRTLGSAYALQASLAVESRRLEALRDFLLPKLLSGEVRVTDWANDGD